MSVGEMLCRIVSVILAVALLIIFIPTVYAEEGTIHLSVQCNKSTYDFDVTRNNKEWFVCAENLAAIADCKTNVNKDNNTIYLYKEKPFVILYSVGLESCVINSGVYYVPLKETSESIGIRLYGTPTLYADVYRTPKQLLEELDDIFYDQRYQITQILLSDGYWLADTVARVYTIMPFVGNSSFVGVISGEAEAERYRNAFASILMNNGEMAQFIASIADFSGEVHKNAKIMKAVTDLTQKDGKLYNELLSKGVNVDFLNSVAYERDTYDALDSFFEGWSKVLSSINFDHFLDLCSFYATSVDTEESTLLAMKRVFENSNNENSRTAVRNLIDARYGDGLIAITDIYDGMIWNITMEYINDQAEKIYNGGYEKAAGLIARGFDTLFAASDKSEAYIYFPIYASIQQDLYNYYQLHKDDGNSNTIYDMRAIAIMYLKAAISAYKYASFDDGISDTVEYAIDVLENELANVLSYTEQEYMPDYNNQGFIENLDKRYGEDNANLIPTPTEDIKTPEETVYEHESTDLMPDGEYYGMLESWSATSMTVDVLEYSGRSEESYNYILSATGQTMTLDITNATVWLEYAWSDDGREIQCSSIDEALNTKIWGGETTVGENCSKQIKFEIRNNNIVEILILYAA